MTYQAGLTRSHSRIVPPPSSLQGRQAILAFTSNTTSLQSATEIIFQQERDRTMDQSRSERILELAKELLDDIELSRVNCEALLLKSSRLARWVGSEEIKSWLGYEMHGFNSTNTISLKYMSLTGRWTDYKERKGYWGPLAQQEAIIQTQQIKLKNLQPPDTSGNWGVQGNDHASTNRAKHRCSYSSA